VPFPDARSGAAAFGNGRKRRIAVFQIISLRIAHIPRNVEDQGQILDGSTHGGFKLSLHETELAPGGVPHPPHSHVHEEMLFVREGELELILNGRTTLLGPGSCGYLASNHLHGYRNPGTMPAKYFVLALGTDQ
jgi:quercetin dioxygenase-like cupin family protein